MPPRQAPPAYAGRAYRLGGDEGLTPTCSRLVPPLADGGSAIEVDAEDTPVREPDASFMDTLLSTELCDIGVFGDGEFDDIHYVAFLQSSCARQRSHQCLGLLEACCFQRSLLHW